MIFSSMSERDFYDLTIIHRRRDKKHFDVNCVALYL